MITNNFIAKIEGHGALDIDWAKKKAQLKILEGERLFEGILNGRPAEEAPWITSRICGICPIAHNLASLKAVEAALGVIPNRTTILLRKLMVFSQMIQSHTLHLFFLALPDYLGLDRGLELAKKKPEFFKIAVNLKEISDQISQTIAGRSLHPTTTTIGGFHKTPDKKILKDLSRKLDKNFSFAVAGAEAFSRLRYPQYNIELEFVSQTSKKDYPDYELTDIISSKVVTSEISRTSDVPNIDGGNFWTSDVPKFGVTALNDYSKIEKYKEDIQEEIRKNSTAKFGRYKKREIMVGALARIATHQKYLFPLCQKYVQKINFKNPFYNNLAQAVEILHFYKKVQEIIGVLLQEKLDSRIVPRSSNPLLKGIGAIEAPRGGLYHEIHLDNKGKIIFANIITPTVQNLTSIEKSAQAVLDQSPKISLDEAKKLIEMLIRAYDPCITCAVH